MIMRKELFHFDLPSQLIADAPTAERSGSRLLVLDKNSSIIEHRLFLELPALLNSGDLLVFNNTKVIPARLWGEKASGGKIEVLVERIIGERSALAHIRASKSPKPGSQLNFADGFSAEMAARHDALFELHFNAPLLELLDKIGHMPLPPYIDRPDEDSDKERYQTVYNEKPGAVAAPTAGLHFDNAILAKLKAKGVQTEFVTLHVGAGTFQPVKVDNVEEHVMHAEYAEVPETVVAAIKATKAAGKRVIAVGTTSMRSLESAAKKADETDELIVPFYKDTSIFIYPGFTFKVVDAMFTNFHLPESTLMMLISALAGQDNVMHAYAEAIKHEYRFFSYGDSMFIEKA